MWGYVCQAVEGFLPGLQNFHGYFCLLALGYDQLLLFSYFYHDCTRCFHYKVCIYSINCIKNQCVIYYPVFLYVFLKCHEVCQINDKYIYFNKDFQSGLHSNECIKLLHNSQNRQVNVSDSIGGQNIINARYSSSVTDQQSTSNALTINWNLWINLLITMVNDTQWIREK